MHKKHTTEKFITVESQAVQSQRTPELSPPAFNCL